MNDKTHVGLVDSHSKSDGGHDYVNLAFDEFVLVVGPLLVAKARVVGHSAKAALLQFLRLRSLSVISRIWISMSSEYCSI